MESLKLLSLNARLVVATVLVEAICRRWMLDSPELLQFIDHLLAFAFVDGPDEFDDWEANEPVLFGVALGDPLPRATAELLVTHGVEVDEFRRLIENAAEVLWGSLYGAADDAGSLVHLGEVVDMARQIGIELPDLVALHDYHWGDRGGYGDSIPPDVIHDWRRVVSFGV